VKVGYLKGRFSENGMTCGNCQGHGVYGFGEPCPFCFDGVVYPMVEVFQKGWHAGYSDGGESDCRMFEPTPKRAWESFLHNAEFEAKPLSERVKHYRCTGCGGSLKISGKYIVCVSRCRYGHQGRNGGPDDGTH
jgi:hypothetical protein